MHEEPHRCSTCNDATWKHRVVEIRLKIIIRLDDLAISNQKSYKSGIEFGCVTQSRRLEEQLTGRARTARLCLE